MQEGSDVEDLGMVAAGEDNVGNLHGRAAPEVRTGDARARSQEKADRSEERADRWYRSHYTQAAELVAEADVP